MNTVTLAAWDWVFLVWFLLAVLSVAEVGGLGALVAKVTALETQHGRGFLALFPSGWDAFTFAVLGMVLLNWWAVYYPGAEPGGGGYVAQRMLAAKDERHARAGTLWFIVAHYVLRPWPWILVALSALVLAPEASLAEPQKAYPAMFALLPVGPLGLVVASFFAAYMSTITTPLNLSASYLVNDLYLPFLARGQQDARALARVARCAVVLVTALGCLVAWYLESAGGGWMLLMELTAGTGLVLILRWLWWRVNAWSEIAAMLASAAVALVLLATPFGKDLFVQLAGDARSPLVATFRMLATIVVATCAWLSVTLTTRPVAHAHLRAFYERVRPAGWWGPIARATGLPPARIGRELAMWVASTALVFGALIGSGSALLLDLRSAIVFLAVAAAGGGWLWFLFARERLPMRWSADASGDR